MRLIDELNAFLFRPSRQGPMRPADLWRRRIGDFLVPALAWIVPAGAFAMAYRLDGSLPWDGGMEMLGLHGMARFFPTSSSALLAMGWAFAVLAVLFTASSVASVLVRRRGREFTMAAAVMFALAAFIPFSISFERFQGSAALTVAVVQKSLDDYGYASEVMRRHGLHDEAARLASRAQGMLVGHGR